MPLTEDDLNALRLLLREEVPSRHEFKQLEAKIDSLRNEMNSGFDELFKRDETREQENLVIKHQLGELDKKRA